MKKRSSQELKKLVETAEKAIIAEQKVNYNFLCEKLGTNSMAAIAEVLKRLKRKKVVAQTQGRKCIVLVAQDGTKRPVPDGVQIRKVARKSKRRRVSAPKSAPKVPAPRKTGNGITQAVKLHKLNQIAAASGEGTETARILKAIAADLVDIEHAHKLKQALS